MKPSLWDYVREAFNARPIGMFLPPNWAMLARFGLPPAYLHVPGLAGARRRRRARLPAAARPPTPASSASSPASCRPAATAKASASRPRCSRRCPTPTSAATQTLAQRCLGDPRSSSSTATRTAPGYGSQSDSLGRLTWMYLRLLATRQAILRVLREGAPRPGRSAAGAACPGGAGLSRAGSTKRLAELTPAPRRSGARARTSGAVSTSQADILEQRGGPAARGAARSWSSSRPSSPGSTSRSS